MSNDSDLHWILCKDLGSLIEEHYRLSHVLAELSMQIKEKNEAIMKLSGKQYTPNG